MSKKPVCLLIVLALILSLAACTAVNAPSADRTRQDDPALSSAAPTIPTVPVSGASAGNDPSAETEAEIETLPPASAFPEGLPGYYRLETPPPGAPGSAAQMEAVGSVLFFVINGDGYGYFHNTGHESKLVCSDGAFTVLDNGTYLLNYQLEGDSLTVFMNGEPWGFRRRSEPAPEPGTAKYALLGLFRTKEILPAEGVLLETEDFRIEASGLTLPEHKEDNYTVVLKITNKGDKGLDVNVDRVLVNGIFLPSEKAQTGVYTGLARELSVPVSMEYIRLAGFGDPTALDLHLTVRATGVTDPLFSDYISFYPLGPDKASRYASDPAADDLLYENEKVRLRFAGIREDTAAHTVSVLYLAENMSDEPLKLFLTGNSFGGHTAFLENTVFSVAVPPHTPALLRQILHTDVMASFGIDTDLTKLNEIAFTLEIRDEAGELQQKTGISFLGQKVQP